MIDDPEELESSGFWLGFVVGVAVGIVATCIVILGATLWAVDVITQ